MSIFLLLLVFFVICLSVNIISTKVYGYSIINFSQTTNLGLMERKQARVNALSKAKDFLGPYSDIWGNFVLSNRFCSVRLDSKKKQVYCKSKLYDAAGRKHFFVAEKFDMIAIDDYWNTLCNMFSMQTNYQQVFNSCKTIAYLSTVDYIENKEKATLNKTSNENFETNYSVNSAYSFKEFYPQIKNKNQATPKKVVENFSFDENDDLLDINNASEAEITELPGINIVIAKKIVKERNENGPYSSKKDFFNRINMKANFASRIETLICIKEMNVKVEKHKNTERIVDFE